MEVSELGRKIVPTNRIVSASVEYDPVAARRLRTRIVDPGGEPYREGLSESFGTVKRENPRTRKK